MREGVDEVAVGVCLEALQGHGPTGRIADEAFQLIPPMRRNGCIGMERKAVHTGTARPRELWCLALRAKTRADTADVLPGPVPKGDALLYRGCHGVGEFRGGLAQGIIPGGHGGLDARFQIAQLAELANDSVADLPDHGGNVRVGRGLALEKAWRATLVRAIQIDSLQEEQVIVHMDETRSTTP